MRLIDADELMEILEAWRDEADKRNANINLAFASAVIAQVQAMPTIEPQRETEEWIPCSKRLPEKELWNEAFLVTVQCEHVDGWPDYVVCGAEYSEYGWAYVPNPLGSIKVVAWKIIDMEAYQPEGQENETD